jgi:hypothetical protein
MRVGLILKGLLGFALGPVWTVASGLAGLLSGSRSLGSVALSLGFSGFFDFDFDAFEYEVDPNPPEEVAGSPLVAARAVLECGAEELLRGYEMSRTPSGLHVARTALVDVSSGTPRLDRVLVPRGVVPTRPVQGRSLPVRTLHGRTLHGRSL